MIWIDYTISGFLVLSAITGMFRAYHLEMLAFFNWLIGIGVGLGFYKEFSVFLLAYHFQAAEQACFAFLALLAITLLVGALIGVILRHWMSKPSFFDRVLGLFFGLARACVILTVMIMLSGFSQISEVSWWHESRLIQPFQQLVIKLQRHLPKEFADSIHYH